VTGCCTLVGWFNANPYSPQDTTNPSNTLSLPREVTYDGNQLVANPVSELASLREAALGSVGAITLAPQASLQVLDSPSTTFDLEMEVALPDGLPLSFGVSIMAGSSLLDTEVILKIHVAPPGQVARLVNVSAEVPFAAYHRELYNTSFAFELPTSETTMGVRILADRSVVETFIAGGRGVVTSPVLSPGAHPNRTGLAIFANQTSLRLIAANAWEMGCGWA